MFAVPLDRVVRIHASSGTTGQPTVVGYTKNDIEMWSDVVARSIRAAGGRPGDRIHVAYGYGLFTGGLGAHYGLSEVIGPGVASECVETKDGLHVWEDHFYPEVIDPATGDVLPDDERGELVFTSLTKEALPVVRYRTRDLTRLLPGTARTMRRIEKITGRSDDVLIVRSVNLFPTQVEELILRVPGLSPHFQLVLSRPKRLDELTVRVEARPDAASADERAGCAQQLAGLIKENVGVTAAVDVLEPDLIERSAGKAQRVLDLRND
jgi:phenylacetate-CoA ligase